MFTSIRLKESSNRMYLYGKLSKHLIKAVV